MDTLTLPPSLSQTTPWSGPTGDPIWPLTLFGLRRNLARFHFPAQMQPKEKKRLLDLLEHTYNTIVKQGLFLPAEKLTSWDKEWLCERFLCAESLRHEDEGAAFGVDAAARFLALFNAEDHLCVQWLDTGATWETTWAQLTQLEHAFNQELGYAFSAKFGYLTSRVAQCGTGLRVHAYLHLPILKRTHALSTLLPTLEGVRLLGLESTPLDAAMADLFVVQNSWTLGVAEEVILRSVHAAATQLAQKERDARAHLTDAMSNELRDLVSRAYGLLVHSYQLATRETLEALSMVKLGIDLGWITGISDQELNRACLDIQRGHLAYLLQRPFENATDVQHQRAAFVHKKFHDVQIKTIA